jgi:hypothetical protein
LAHKLSNLIEKSVKENEKPEQVSFMDKKAIKEIKYALETPKET